MHLFHRIYNMRCFETMEIMEKNKISDTEQNDLPFRDILFIIKVPLNLALWWVELVADDEMTITSEMKCYYAMNDDVCDDLGINCNKYTTNANIIVIGLTSIEESTTTLVSVFKHNFQSGIDETWWNDTALQPIIIHCCTNWSSSHSHYQIVYDDIWAKPNKKSISNVMNCSH